jgi:hypothetical protein
MTFPSIELLNEKHGLSLTVGDVVTVAGRKAILKRAHAGEHVEIRFEDTGERNTIPVTQLDKVA